MLSQDCIVEEDEFGNKPLEIEVINLTTGRTLDQPPRLRRKRR